MGLFNDEKGRDELSKKKKEKKIKERKISPSQNGVLSISFLSRSINLLYKEHMKIKTTKYIWKIKGVLKMYNKVTNENSLISIKLHIRQLLET